MAIIESAVVDFDNFFSFERVFYNKNSFLNTKESIVSDFDSFFTLESVFYNRDNFSNIKYMAIKDVSKGHPLRKYGR